MLTQQELKQNAARAALDYVLPQLGPKVVLGVGTGSTVDLFIDELAAHKHAFRAAVSSSERSAARLRGHGITVLDRKSVGEGTGGSVRGDLGGRRQLKKKKK